MRNTLAILFTSSLAPLALIACGGDEPAPQATTTTSSSSSTTGAGGAGGSGGEGGTGGQGGSGGTAGAGGTADVDILEQIQKIPGVTAAEGFSDITGYRYFEIDFQQPVDHDDPNGQSFTQRLVLHHIDTSAPFVLASTGYYLWGSWQYLEEPAELLGANQLIVEHRYFYPSRPEPADWTELNIKQAASDHHRIVEAFRPIYEGKWISTGVSKGGMTSVYHRRFFPNDVDGTVAYVAPHSSGIDDPRYVDFLNQVGDATCRQKLKDFQAEVLNRRDAMLARLQQLGDINDVKFDLIGIGPTLEITVISFPFAFWQYHGADRCKDIPGAAASDNVVWAFLDEIGLPLYGADPWVLGFEPYYWQAYTQLGTPGIDTSHIDNLLMYDLKTIDDLPSIAAQPVHDPAVMTDVGTWLTTEGERIIFIYGETDPWSAAAFDFGGAKDTYKLVVPGGNHGATIAGLEPADQPIALDALAAWTGVTPVLQPKIMPPRPAPPPLRLLRSKKP